LLRRVPIPGGMPPAERLPLYWEFHEGGFSQAILMNERWKAIRMKSLAAPVELYDTMEDVAETKDIAAEKPELVARARELFQTSRADSPEWPVKGAGSAGAK
jgi:hypothetical protein